MLVVGNKYRTTKPKKQKEMPEILERLFDRLIFSIFDFFVNFGETLKLLPDCFHVDDVPCEILAN